MPSRPSPPAAASVVVGVATGAAVAWLLGTASGRRRLASALPGRRAPVEAPTHIELPDVPSGLGALIAEGLVEGEAIAASRVSVPSPLETAPVSRLPEGDIHPAPA